MKVYLQKISGIDDAIVSMTMSKRTWTPELETKIREAYKAVTDRDGRFLLSADKDDGLEAQSFFFDMVDKLLKWGVDHITMLRFIEFSITVEGLHRAGQDDWDAHAKRYENRIIRTSTRLSEFGAMEMSDFYKGKILPMDMALKAMNLDQLLPDSFKNDEGVWVRATNGYIKEEYANDKDVKRGLYMLSIPSNFIFKVNLTEWGHVYKERKISGRAHPEVKQCCEMIADELAAAVPWFTRELFDKIKN